MWAKPTEHQLSEIPKLYEQEKIPLQDQIVHGHYFIGGTDWYVTEFDGKDIFFGYAILNGDYFNAEWGYFSFGELKSLKVAFMEVDFDQHWKKRPAKEVDKIAQGMGWEVSV